jgi:hypothetical protein
MTTVLLMLAAVHCANPVNTAVPKNSGNGATAPIVVSICTVVENPGRYDGKRVTVSGCVTTDGREYEVLSNLAKPCSRGGIVPVFARGLRREQRFDAEPDKKVCGTFTGIFRASNGLYDRVLEIEQTSDLEKTALMK